MDGTVEELRDYAKNTLGLEVTTRMTKAELVALINGEDKTPAPVEVQEVVTNTDEKRIKIRIQSEKDDKSPVVVGVNGYFYRIQRDVEVEVPQSVIDVLNNAVETRYDKDSKPYEVLAYQFTRL